MDSIDSTMLLLPREGTLLLMLSMLTTAFDHLDEQILGKSSEEIGHRRMLSGFLFLPIGFFSLPENSKGHRRIVSSCCPFSWTNLFFASSVARVELRNRKRASLSSDTADPTVD